MKGFFHSFSLVAILVLGGTLAAYSQTPVVPAGSVINGASFDTTGQPLAAGSLISIFGTDLAGSLDQSRSIPLSTSLSDGVSVKINGLTAPLLFVSSGQINAQLPWGVLPISPPGTSGTAQVVITRSGVASAPVSVPVTVASPGIFTTQFGVGQAIAYGASSYIYAAAPGTIPGLTTSPAKIGDSISILATGLGPVDTTVKDGDVPPVLISNTLTTPTVLVGSVPAQVTFSGLVGRDATGTAQGFVAVYQVNIIIPPGTPTGNAVPLQIRMNGITSTNKATIAVSN
jgi:uncharacterized protein (TIGR03437 family)